MKATGVVRRIDELGRIVIPKEIRKNLKIRDGESIEIFTDNNNQIILKKYSLSEDYEMLIQNYLESLYSILKKSIIVTDRDKFITGIGEFKKDLEKKEISNTLLNIIDRRDNVVELNPKNLQLTNSFETDASYIIKPIISSGECIGLIILLSKGENLNSSDEKIIGVAANFLGKYIEN